MQNAGKKKYTPTHSKELELKGIKLIKMSLSEGLHSYLMKQ